MAETKKERREPDWLSIFLIITVIVMMIPLSLSGVIDAISDYRYAQMHSDIVLHNEERLANPIDYDVCQLYVSTNENHNVYISVLTNIKELSDSICENAETDYDKIVKMAYYVAENTYYDFIAAETSVTEETISLENILSTKKTVCAGYANLFSALCSMQDIYCLNLRGGTILKHNTDNINLCDAPVNHEWNAVFVDNEWIFIDTTWCSNNTYTETGYDKANDFDDKYAIMTMDDMSHDHRIDFVDYRNFKKLLEEG